MKKTNSMQRLLCCARHAMQRRVNVFWMIGWWRGWWLHSHHSTTYTAKSESGSKASASVVASNRSIHAFTEIIATSISIAFNLPFQYLISLRVTYLVTVGPDGSTRCYVLCYIVVFEAVH